MEDPRVLSIRFDRIRKGDVITNEQVEFHYVENMVGRENYEAKLAEYERGERLHHPMGLAHTRVSEEIMRECAALGYRVVCRSRQKSIEVLTDAQAVVYRSNRANSALGLHRKQVSSLHQDIDVDQLSSEEKRQLVSTRNYHAMVEVSIGSAKRTLKAMDKGEINLSPKPKD